MTDQEQYTKLQEELKVLKDRIDSAFIKDDYGAVDYGGHRKYHKKIQDDATEREKVKMAISQKIITWAAILIISTIGIALSQYFIKYINGA